MPQGRLYAKIITTMPELWHKLAHKHKDEFLTSEIASEKPLKILEIGPGPRPMLEYYPAGSEVYLLEPNTYFSSEINARQATNHDRNLKIIVIHDKAENMLQHFEEGYFDIVTTALVFCSLKDPLLVVENVSSVLKKGGKWLMIEHVKSWGVRGRASQRMLKWFPLWRFVIRCDPLRQPQHIIKDSFAQFTFDCTNLKMPVKLKAMQYVMRGVATK